MRRWVPAALVLVPVLFACRETVFDILTNERIVRVPSSTLRQFTVSTGPIDLPVSLGHDKIVDSATLNLTATNFNAENSVRVRISVASETQPNQFGPVATFDLAVGETRSLQIVQANRGDALVLATQSESINVRFESVAPEKGIGEIEFTFTVRVRAHKNTPGTGPGTLLFY